MQPYILAATLVLALCGRLSSAQAVATGSLETKSPMMQSTSTPHKPRINLSRQPAPTIMNFRCDGRQYCSQMTSRGEAEYFLQHCPDPRMDGDSDGIPCENDSRF